MAYDFGPQMADLNLAFGVKNIFDQDYFIRSYDDNNKGIYAGQPRTLYMQVVEVLMCNARLAGLLAGM